mgnify:CR=1 FL=1
MRDAGFTYSYIGDKFGVSRQRIEQICRASRLPKRISVIYQREQAKVYLGGVVSRGDKSSLDDREYRELVKRGREFRTNLTGRDFSRELARVRDNHTCQLCFKIWRVGERRFDMHHLNGLCGKLSTKYENTRDMLPNVLTLCHRCHFNHHQFSKNINQL